MNFFTIFYKKYTLFFWITIIHFFIFVIQKTHFFSAENLKLSENFWALQQQPWSILTYGFLHSDFSHLFFNSVLLFFSIQTLNTLQLQKNYFLIYNFGIIFGGIFFSIIQYFFGKFNASLVGSSAGIMALFFFGMVKNPFFVIRFFGILQMPFVALGIIFLAIDVFNISISENTGGHLAHLGGAFFGGILGYFSSTFFKKKKKNTKKIKSFLSKKENIHQQEINAILQKISKSGYESLSDTEKTFLFRASSQK